MMNGQRPRVLILAETANPNWISVPLVGYTHVRAIASFADIHLVTNERNRADILTCGFSPQHVSFVSAGMVEHYAEKIAVALEGRGAMGGATKTAFQVPLYYVFEWIAFRLMRERLARGEFDLVHRVTPVSPAMPSLFAVKCRQLGFPFIVGPLNGGVPWPRGWSAVRHREGEWVGYLREGHKLLPYYRATRRHAAAILCGSAVAWREVRENASEMQCFYVPENAVDLSRFAKTTQAYGERPLRIAYVGRLVPYKGADLLLRAAAPLLREGRARVDIIGDGPERERLTRLASELGVASSVRLDGWVPHAALQDRLRESSVFCFPSVREFGGAVVMEAMALGLVPVVVDYGGPSEIVNEGAGFRVPLGEPKAIVDGVRQVLDELARLDPSSLAALGARARSRILAEFSIEAKTEKTRRIYQWVAGRSAERPTYEPPAHALALYA